MSGTWRISLVFLPAGSPRQSCTLISDYPLFRQPSAGSDATLVQARYLRYSAQIDDKSVISRKPLARFEQGNASTRVQDGPGLDHGSSRPKLCYLSGLPTHLALTP